MPKIYEYFGFVFFFYSNEHEPIHVHVIHGDRQMIYEIILEDGKFKSLTRRNAKGYLPLSQHDIKITDEFIKVYALEISTMHSDKEKTMKIVDAVYAGDLSLKITFNDGFVRTVDFRGFLSAHPHPQHDKYNDPDLFKTFLIENGNIVWGEDWDMVFPVESLYSGILD